MAMNERYEPQAIEGKWQTRWEEAGAFRAGTRPGAPKKYILEMLPYPSGKMHMGHVRNYLIGDVYARYFRMKGYDVVHPMGWDAFGLPAENAAIKDGVHPAVRTQENIDSFKAEMRSLGYAYDWDARGQHQPARVLPVEPVVLHPDAAARAGVPALQQGELVHGLSHRHRQRAGEGGHLRAL